MQQLEESAALDYNVFSADCIHEVHNFLYLVSQELFMACNPGGAVAMYMQQIDGLHVSITQL